MSSDGKRVLLWAGASIVFLVTLGLGAGYVLPRYQQRAAARAWAESFEPMETLLARYPKRDISPAAAELARLAQPLGIELVSRSEPTPQLDAVVRFVSTQQNKADDGEEEVPPEVIELLGRHGHALETIETLLLTGQRVFWETDVGRLTAAPFPSLLEHRNLQSMLLARALEAGRGGDHSKAARALDAAWAASRSLSERPDLISQLVVSTLSTMQNGVLRRLPQVPAQWQGYLASSDERVSMLRSFQMEAWVMSEVFRGIGRGELSEYGDPLPTGDAAPKRGAPSVLVQRLLVGPYMELCAANFSARLQRAAADLRRHDPCAADRSESPVTLPRWNMFGRIFAPDFNSTWISVGCAEVDRELTRLVLVAKASRSAPVSPPASRVESSVCQGLVWDLTPAADGGVTIAARSHPFRDPKRTPLLSFRLGHR